MDLIPINQIFANPDQPRKDFDQEALGELSASIKQRGVIQPIVVTPRGKSYMIIAGERRWRASSLAGLKKMPARIIEADDALVEEMSLIENIQRQDLNIIEEANAYKKLLERPGMTNEALAQKLGFRQVWRIDEKLSLLNLKPEYQRMAVNNELTNSQAFEMSRVLQNKQDVVLKKIKAGELNSYNKLRSFVDGLLALEKQDAFFALTILSEGDRDILDQFKTLISTIEKFLKTFYEPQALYTLKKATIHTDIQVERLDLIIQALMKIRKTIMAGEGVKNAMELAV